MLINIKNLNLLVEMIDISYNIEDTICVYPGTQKYITNIDGNSSIFIIDSHHGTHIDAPSHFIKGGKNISEIDTDLFVGNVQIITIDNHVIDNRFLKTIDIKSDKIFFNCVGNDMMDQFDEQYCGLNYSGAKYLSNMNIKMVGINYVSIEEYNNDNFSAHIELLENDILIVEGLKLNNIDDGVYEYILLPINTYNEASPTRVMLKNK